MQSHRGQSSNAGPKWGNAYIALSRQSIHSCFGQCQQNPLLLSRMSASETGDVIPFRLTVDTW